MDAKLEKRTNLETLENVINQFMEEEILKKGRVDYLEKWNYFSLLDLEKNDKKEKLLESVSYIIELSLTEEEKISRVLTLSYLIIKEGLQVDQMDINDIYLLVSYLDTLSLNDISSSLKYLNQKDLLTAIRMKSLDLDVRFSLLKYIDKTRGKIKEILSFIEETEYYELVKLVS